MNVKFGVMPESFKLLWGDRARMNPKMVDEMPKSIKLVAGKNDVAAFQLVVTADERYALNISKQLWFSQNAKRRNIRVCAEMPFECELNHIGMHLCDDAYLRADSLLTCSVVESEDDDALSVYCEMKIPACTEKGSYTGKIKLYESHRFSGETLIGEVEVTVEVYNYTFPENKDNGFHLDLWMHPSNVARQYEVALWSDEHFSILDKYCKSLGELGVKSVTTIVSEVAWNGQGCQNEQRYASNLFEYSMIPVTRHADGTIECDYSILQRYIDINAKYGIKEAISVFGLVNVWGNKDIPEDHTAPDYPDGIHIRVFDETTGSYDYLRTAKELDTYIKMLENYFTVTGQLDRVRIAADEPADVDAYRASLEHIKSVAPTFKYKTAINHAEFVNEFGKDIYDFAPYISPMFNEYEALMKFKEEMPDKRFIYYVCCGPDLPNNFIRSELVESYYIGILAAYAKMDGFLRWNYTVWTDHPRNDIRYSIFPAGDLNFVYPGSNGNPILTLRWKALKRGIQYFVLIREAEKRNLTDSVNKVYDLVLREKEIAKLYANWAIDKVMSTSYDDYRAAEEELLKALEG